MGFGTDLRGGVSHDALVRVQDTEIRLLEMLHQFIIMRIDNDRKYATGLGKMLHVTHKAEYSEFKDCCSIFKAWDVIVKETNSLMRAMKSNADHMASSTLDVLTQLISEKKAARTEYMAERHRLHTRFAGVQEESSRYHSEYAKSVERLQGDKAKLSDMQARGKAGPKIDEAKNKYCRSVVRLHKVHNDYIISVNKAKEHQVLLRESALPAVLDFHQERQESLVHKTKYLLDDFVRHIDLSSPDFLAMSQNMTDAVANVRPGSEYSTGFVDLNRSSYIPPLEISFDTNLLSEYHGSLKASVIEVNDLTLENLQSKLSSLSEESTQLKAKIAELNTDHSQISVTVDQLSENIGEGCTLEDIKSFLDKKNQCDNYNKELQEWQGMLKVVEQQIETVKDPLTQLGDNQPPSASDMQDITGNADTASIGTTNTISSTSSSSPTLKDTNFIKSLSKMNPFKKGAKSTSSSSQNNNDDDDRRSNVSNEDGLANSSLEEKSHVRKKPSNSYERSEPFLANANGSGRNSMAQMREHGQLMDMDHNKAKERIADEEWYHGVLPREEVQRLLVNDGNYLVRESKNKRTNETQFVLSVFWQGHRHFIIQFAPDRGWHFEGQAYPSIQELVRRQYDSGLPVTSKSGAILQKAILREWELLNDDIELQMKIGTGNFGEVYKGLYKMSLEVAVKTCKDTLTEDQKIKFLQEGRILKQYNHPNVVRYVGLAAQKQPVMIVMEFIPKGSLLSYLKSHGSTQSTLNFTKMCEDAASGMEYLEGRGCIHRDLAARNCLVGENNIVKISDFGMSREEEEYTVSSGMKQIPVKWTAPEALNFGKYTSLCDVWSFGVLMWEIFACGRSPYTGMTNARAREWIEQGNRLEMSPGTPKSVYQLMKKCWSYRDEDRPHFNEIHSTLQTIGQSL